MVALNIRDIGDGRKAALDAEAKGVPVSELVRRLLDEGIERSRSVRAQQEWWCCYINSTSLQVGVPISPQAALAAIFHALSASSRW